MRGDKVPILGRLFVVYFSKSSIWGFKYYCCFWFLLLVITFLCGGEVVSKKEISKRKHFFSYVCHSVFYVSACFVKLLILHRFTKLLLSNKFYIPSVIRNVCADQFPISFPRICLEYNNTPSPTQKWSEAALLLLNIGNRCSAAAVRPLIISREGEGITKQNKKKQQEIKRCFFQRERRCSILLLPSSSNRCIIIY